MRELIKKQKIGKKLPTDLYVHKDYLIPELDTLVKKVADQHGIKGYNIVKLDKKGKSISYLAYPEFEVHPHPAIKGSVKVDLEERTLKCMDYSNRVNPPILHRKECFVDPTHPQYNKWIERTKWEEAQGWYENTKVIGTRKGWMEVTGGRGDS